MIQNPIFYLFKELKITIATIIMIVALFLVALRLMTPYIPQALPGLKYWVEYQIKTPVSIKELHIVWVGSKPAIRFDGLVLLDETRQNAIIDAQTVDVLLSPLDSIINGRFIVDAVVIDGANMRLEPGNLSAQLQDSEEMDIVGWIEKTDNPIFQSGAAWVEVIRSLPIEQVILKNSAIHIVEPSGRNWPLTDVTAAITRSGESIRMRAIATLLGENPATFSIGANIENAFSAPSGELVFRGNDFDLHQIEDWFDAGIARTKEGRVGFTLWTGLEAGFWKDIKLDVQGYDIALEGTDARTLDVFPQVEGQFFWTPGELPHHWKLIGRKLAVSHQGEPNWLTTRFVLEEYGPKDFPSVSFFAERLQLDAWLPLLVRTNWMPSVAHEFIKAYEPVGVVDYLHLSLNDVLSKVPRFNFQFSGDALGITQPEIGYRFENINIRLDMDNSSGSMEVLSPRVVYTPVGHPDKKLQLDNWGTLINWTECQQGWSVQMPWLVAEVGPGRMEASVGFQTDTAGKASNVSALVYVDQLAAEDILKRFPIGLRNTHFRDWLADADATGYLKDIIFLYRGSLDGFSNNKDVLIARAGLNDLSLGFDSSWPRLERIQADFEMNNLTADINVASGYLGDKFSFSGKAVVPNIDSDNTFVVADAHFTGRLEEVSQGLRHSPIQAVVDEVFDKVTPTGDLDLNLTVNASFKADGPVTVRGLLVLDEASLLFFPENPFEISKVTADIAFSDTNLRAPLITGAWGERDFSAAVNMKFSGDAPFLTLKAKSWIDSDFLEQWANRSLPIAGATPFELALQLPLDAIDGEGGRVEITSDLVGLGIDIPAPFMKPIETKHPLFVQAQMQQSDVIGVDARLSKMLSMAGRFATTEQGWQPVGVHVHLGEDEMATYPQERQLKVDGKLDFLSAEHWQNFIREYFSDMQSDPSVKSANILEPNIHVQVGLLDLWGVPVQELTASVTPLLDAWRIEASAPMIEGTLVIPEQLDKRAIVLDLERLQLPNIFSAEQDGSVEEYKSIVPESFALPAIIAKVQQLQWRDLVMNNFQADLTPKDKGYAYRLQTQSKPLTFDLSGYWGGQVAQEPMTSQGYIQSRDFGNLLRRVDTESAIRDAQGTVDVNLGWLGGVTDFQLHTLSGTIESTLRSGRVLGVEPGIGRILSLLSLSNIQRRLILDFSDITKKGFPFDKITATIICDKGAARTDNFELKGPIANMKFQGKIDLNPDHQINAQLELSPNLESSLPLAAAVAAGNPAVGAFIWAFDKIIGNDISEIIRYRYAISGDWLSPQIEELEVVREKPATVQ